MKLTHSVESSLKAGFYKGWLAATGRTAQEKILKQMLQMQFLSAPETQKQHEHKLIEILRFSLKNVPYYQEHFHALGLSDTDITAKPLEVLAALPLLDKATLRERFEDLKSNDLKGRRWHVNTSGGSTGEPVRFVQDEQYHHAGMGGAALFNVWSGYKPGKSKVILWGSERDLLVGKETLRTSAGRWFRNETTLNAFRMGENDMRYFVDVINQVRPLQILAYADSAFELARFIEREGLKVHFPHSVMTSAGTLYLHMRETIETVFNTKVFNRYGSREMGDIACDCEFHKGLHVNPYTHHVEILREDGSPCDPGEVGEIVVTLLTNKAMPLLRYRIGDMAAWSDQPCDCQRSWPLLKEVSGRVMDVLRRPDGSPVMPEYFIHFIGVTSRGDLDFIKKFQLIQNGINQLRLLIVPSTDIEDARLQLSVKKRILKDLVARVMGNECRLDIVLVDDIPNTASGKYRYTICKVGAQDGQCK
jgi:phenylacetate-CoA ligase